MKPQPDLGRSRLFPSLRDPSYLVLRSRRKLFTQWFEDLRRERLRVLDIGARHQPYRPLLGDRVELYVGLDIRNAELATILADGQALPFAPDSFDLVIATQVFEYFQDPSLAAREMQRVLRPGGMLVGSVAAFSPQFISRERWRFLPEGINDLLRPFGTVEIVPELNDPASFMRNVNVGMGVFCRFPIGRTVYAWTLCPALNLIGAALQKIEIRSSGALTCNYSIRAVK